MGGGSSKHYNFQDYHERFVFGQTAVHNVVRRSLEVVLKETDLEQNGKDNAADAQKLKDLLRYTDLFRMFVETHHTQEDRHIFPMAAKLAEKEDLFTEESADHEKLAECLAAIKKLTSYSPPAPKAAEKESAEKEAKAEKESEKEEKPKAEAEEEKPEAEAEEEEKPKSEEAEAESEEEKPKADKEEEGEAEEEKPKEEGEKAEEEKPAEETGEAEAGAEEKPKEEEKEKAEVEEAEAAEVEPAKSPEEILGEIHAVVKDIDAMMSSHLEREEKILTAEFWREKSNEKDVKKLNKDIHVLTRNGEFMPKKAGLPWLQYHLTDNEQVFFDDILPFIVKRMVFPSHAKSESVGVWQFSTNPNIVDGKAIFPKPQWVAPDAPAESSSEKETKQPESDADEAAAAPSSAAEKEEENPAEKAEAAESADTEKEEGGEPETEETSTPAADKETGEDDAPAKSADAPAVAAAESGDAEATTA